MPKRPRKRASLLASTIIATANLESLLQPSSFRPGQSDNTSLIAIGASWPGPLALRVSTSDSGSKILCTRAELKPAIRSLVSLGYNAM
jgi:hypothetical protein